MKSLRILHLEASSGWGGQEMRILKEAVAMRLRGHVVVFAVMKKGLLVDQARKEGFVVYEMNFKKPYWLLTLFQLLRILSKHRIDIVNTHSSLDSWIGGIAARLFGARVVRTRHLSTPIKPGWNSYFLYGKLADRVVTTCAAIVPTIVEQSRKNPSLCRSIPTGVHPDKIQVDSKKVTLFRESLGFKQKDFLVGTACFMRSWKGIGDLLKAADLLRNEEIRWVIIGGGHIETYRQKAKDLNLDGIVSFTGHLEDPFFAIKALDVFTLLSTAHEGVSQAILQAAYLERPLVATPTGGLNEVCIHQKTGLQVPIFSPKEVADSVLYLRDHPDERQKFGSEAKKLVLERFTFQTTADQMEEVYESAFLKN